MNHRTPFCIISAERPQFGPVANGRRTSSLFHRLNERGFSIVPVEGIWEGQPERSYLVSLPFGDSGDGYEEILEAARFYGQAAVLYVDGARRAYLDNPETRTITMIGTWAEVAAGEANPAGMSTLPDGTRFTVRSGVAS